MLTKLRASERVEPELRSSSLDALVLRLDALEARVASLEGAAAVGGGFRCACCQMPRPSDWFIYEAWNPETKQTIAPLCGPCAQRSAVGGLPWKYEGPFNQKAQNDRISDGEPQA